MENFYLILVVILFALAISDLVVGVSNDAVNFLNSALGSKAAPKWVIFLLASDCAIYYPVCFFIPVFQTTKIFWGNFWRIGYYGYNIFHINKRNKRLIFCRF